MYTLAVVTDNRNHEFLFQFLKKRCSQIAISEVPLRSIVGDSLEGNFQERIKKARNVSRWVKENKEYNAVLIFSDYNFAYRTLVHFCRLNKTPIFIYQDGFIVFEPWPKDIFGIFKRLVYRGFKFFGYGHLISYLSFHTNPDLVFSWGDFFTRTFSNITSGKIVTLGSIMYAKEFKVSSGEEPLSKRILYYGTFYREHDKNIVIKTQAIDNLKKVMLTEDGLICDIKLHPLDKDRLYLDELLHKHSPNTSVNFLGNDFLLHENATKYRFIISEFSTETIFASIFCSNIYFIKNSLNEKHFRLLKDFLTDQRIGDNEYYKIDQNRIGHFQSEFFQKFNIERFEQAVQTYN